MKRFASFLIAVLVTACSVPAPDRTAPAGRVDDPAVTRRPLPEQPSASPAVPSAPRAAGATPDAGRAPAGSGIAAPPGALYVCVTEARGERRQVAIDFAPKVQALCERHPEMGPCQYERANCRQGGGRVFDASGQEITPAIEAEYDRKVMRFRLRSN